MRILAMAQALPRHGRKRNKSRALRGFGRQMESTESRERPLGLRKQRQFLFCLHLTSNALTNQLELAGNRKLPNYGWRACMPHYGQSACMPILVAKISNAYTRQINKLASPQSLKSVVVSPKTDCQSKKWFSYGA